MVKRVFAVCFLQAKEAEKCPLSDEETDDPGPLILFLIDIKNQRSVFECPSVKLCFNPA